jgi:LacI family transcriptional regulator
VARSSDKYGEIVRALESQLAAGVYRPGDRVPSENELAVHFFVARPTAARALRELETAGLVERRAGSGTYVREGRLQSRMSGQRTFGLLVPGLGATEILDPVCTEITKVCQAAGSNVLWGDSSSPSDAVTEVDRLCRYYLERKVDGVFFVPLEAVPDRQAHNVRIAELMTSAGVALVLLDRDTLDYPDRSDFDLVGIDNFQAGHQVGRHLLQDGRHRIRFLARPQHPPTTDLRAAGVRDALDRAGVEVDGRFQLSGVPDDDQFVRSVVDQERPDAIVCSNDRTAALVIQTLSRFGISVPDDVAVVGFDDVRYSTLLSVALTTIRQPLAGIARAAVKAIDDRIDKPDMDPRQILLHGELVIRQSCSGPAGAAAGRH